VSFLEGGVTADRLGKTVFAEGFVEIIEFVLAVG